MLTIYEALKLPALKGTKLLAGDRGVENSIKWVTTIEIIEDISRFHSGEFVVTTGFGLEKNENYRERLLKLIQLKVLSGMAIYTGFYLESIPPEIIQKADDEGLPLIEIPTTINFSTITKAIVEQIGNQQMHLLKNSLNVHKEMTKLALNNDGLDEVLWKVSNLMDASIFVFDDINQLQGSTNIHEEIEIRENKIFIEDKSFDLEKLFRTSNDGGTAIKAFPIKGFYCFCSPIKAESFMYGYLLAVQKKSIWTDMDDIFMDHVSTLVGIELVKKYAIEETRAGLQGELVEEIIKKEFLNQDNAIKRGKKLGFDLTKTHSVFYLKVFADDRPLKTSESLSQHLHYVVSQSLYRTNRQHILLPKFNSLTALIETNMREKSKEKDQLRLLAALIKDRWCKHFSEKLMIGIGNPYEQLDHLSLSAKEAENAVKYSPLLLKGSDIVHFDELGFYQVLLKMQEGGISLKGFYENYLGNLIQSTQHRTDLILTLETFLAHNCNLQQTSSSLYIHRHTLKYRLSQIEKRTGLSLQSPNDRLNLHLAILAYKFVQLQKQQDF
ncbi:purine catabolism regulator [Evansella vedderi]|uniref:Purine catabolism regulator n=1 Tax=Evansella vedderi TaxID=38282 RepID=A0ABT9ZVE6_9BACI|nr:PucR family transcriptional regulator [Evansella vedderi]MDQ0255208.1 purine catabolism regulator [Evansella vedderi]